MSDRGLINTIFSNRSTYTINLLKFHPDKLTIRQILIIAGLLGGKYSIPLLCALAAGYNFGNVPKSWFDASLPPIPPELEELEMVVMSKKELRALKSSGVVPAEK